MRRFRASAALPVLVAAGLVANGLRLRRRLGALPTLAPSEEPVGDDVCFVTAAGVTVDEPTRRASAARAHDQDLAVLDLVPADLPVDAALGLVRGVDPAAYRNARMAPGCGAHHAMIITADVFQRTGTARTGGLDPVEMVRLTAEAKRCAPAGADLAVAPGLPARPGDLDRQRAAFAALGFPPLLVLAPAVVRHGLLIAGLLTRPALGVLALCVYWAQPYLVFAKTPVRPRDLHSATLTRPVREPYTWIRILRGRWRSPAHEEAVARWAAARDRYAADLAAGVERFFEPRRADCPWCGSTELAVRLVTPDTLQGKPGRFRLDAAARGGHVFQNPRLTPEGLEFYYRDFYDGLGGEANDFALSLTGAVYRDRARMLAPFTTPESWLDVGTGHGHFCLAAREVWPETAFDGLDMSDNIDEAARRGWVDRGWRGFFPDLAGELAGRYDVISMSHYLEHTREPYAELDAAAKVLTPGGLLLIEVPDPEWPLARLLGRWWVGWSQPQHLHLIPIGNLKRALAERDLTVVAEDRGRAHMPIDFSGAVLFGLGELMPSLAAWSPITPTLLRRLQRLAVWMAGGPFLLAGGLVDQTIKVAVRDSDRGNAYRVLARKDDATAPSAEHPEGGDHP